MNSIQERLMAHNFNPAALRPYAGTDGTGTYIDALVANTLKPQMVSNANATLLKDEWIAMDSAVIRTAKPRLRLINDCRAAGMRYTLPNGLASTVLQYQSLGDISGANVSMDGLNKSNNDRHEIALANLPLPIIHKDFSISLRQLQTSRRGLLPFDTTMVEAATRTCAEEAERLVLGTGVNVNYGGGQVYGLLNFPDRLTKSMTLPSASGWTGKTLLTEVMAMKKLSTDKFMFGPWVLYVSPGWDAKIDEDYSDAKGTITIRERLRQISGITDIRVLDFLTGYQMVLLQQTSDVFRVVEGMDFTTLQWDTQGGMEVNFKVMGMFIPQPRTDFNKNCGIVHGTAV